MLASEYIKKKEYEKARKMIDSLPKQQADKRILNARLLLAQEKHDEAAVMMERKLTDVLNDLSIVLSMLMNIAFAEGNMKRAEKIASTGEQTALLYDQWGYSSLLLPMDLALKKKGRRKKYCIYPGSAPNADGAPAYVGVCVLLPYIRERKFRKKV